MGAVLNKDGKQYRTSLVECRARHAPASFLVGNCFAWPPLERNSVGCSAGVEFELELELDSTYVVTSKNGKTRTRLEALNQKTRKNSNSTLEGLKLFQAFSSFFIQKINPRITNFCLKMETFQEKNSFFFKNAFVSYKKYPLLQLSFTFFKLRISDISIFVKLLTFIA